MSRVVPLRDVEVVLADRTSGKAKYFVPRLLFSEGTPNEFRPRRVHCPAESPPDFLSKSLCCPSG